MEKHQKEIQAQFGNYFLRVSSPRLAARVAPALHSGEVTLEACFSEEVKSLLGGAFRDNEVVDSSDVNEPNYELLKAVLALPEKVHGHMETFEVGLALGEIMGVLKLVRIASFFSKFLLLSTIYTLTASWTSLLYFRRPGIFILLPSLFLSSVQIFHRIRPQLGNTPDNKVVFLSLLDSSNSVEHKSSEIFSLHNHMCFPF